jgi:hypothetical protein
MTTRLFALPLACALVTVALFGACKSDEPKRAPLTREQLLDPKECKTCHPTYYREWASSMHAYASKDPVFRAMNKRGQEEAKLGDFCVKCHAPMAVREGATKDGLNLDDVPEHLQGVTCYFCHNAVKVGKDHFNANIELANDTTMRAALGSSAAYPDPPVKPWAHDVAYSANHDRNDPKSSLLCGTCHDIVTHAGVHLERTLQEYEESLFAKPDGFKEGGASLTCASHHMNGTKGTVANYTGVPLRSVHEHLWPGVDVALTKFPDMDVQRSAVEKCSLANFSIQFFQVDSSSPGSLSINLETSAGHSMPSGAAQDRRLWLEVIAYDAAGKVMLESGKIADDEIEEKPNGAAGHDAQLCMFRDHLLDANGEETHMFWEAASYQSRLMPAAKTAAVGSHTVTCQYHTSTFGAPKRMTVRVRMRPMGLDVLNDLVDSGHLDAAIPAQMPTFTVHEAEVTWDDPVGKPFDFRVADKTDRDCQEYRCLLQHDAATCLP